MSADRPGTRRCSALSLEAGEGLAATATHATEWLVIEVPGPWPRDAASGEGLPGDVREVVVAWRDGGAGEARRRLLFVRRPGRTGAARLVFLVAATEERAEARRLALDDLSDLAGVELEAAGEPVGSGLVLVCGHGSRDRCCASAGTAVFGALARSLGEEELWISSHQGGHRFAANVLVLPTGIQLGRVDPARAPTIVGAALAGEIDLDHYRGRACYAPEAQAAEHAVRAATGLTGIHDVRLQGVDGPAIAFRGTDGAVYRAVVERRPGPEVPPSCGEHPERQSALVGRVVV